MDGGTGKIGLRLAELSERFRRSLFGLPALWVVGLLVLSRVTLAVDRRIDDDAVPGLLQTTVDSANSLLSAIASGTITAASVVFSLTLLSVQLASSQFSPRTLRNFLGDRFQQNVIGLVLGTFAFSLAVLRDLRGPLAEDGSPVLPRVGIAVATVLAIASLFALLGSINSTARGLRVATVTDEIVDETISTIRNRFPTELAELPSAPASDLPVAPEADEGVPANAVVVTAESNGWVQQIAVDALAAALEEGATARLQVTIGNYVIEGQPLAAVWPVSAVDEDLVEDLRQAFSIGRERTLQQDVAYGILQLEDIALRALSPGVNDPNTALSTISQMGAVVLALFERELAAGALEHEGRRIERPHELTHGDYLDSALDKIRRAARDEPVVLGAMLRMLATVRDELQRRRADLPDSTAAIESAAERIVEEAGLGSMLDTDRVAVVEQARRSGLVT